jgi:hypothetical protein
MPDVDIPNEVASKNFLNQGSSGTSATLFTPATSGLFRVAVYFSWNNTAGGSASLTVNWTDEHSFSNSQGIGIASPYGQGQVIMRVASSSNISLSVSGVAFSPGTTGYDVYATVEQL